MNIIPTAMNIDHDSLPAIEATKPAKQNRTAATWNSIRGLPRLGLIGLVKNFVHHFACILQAGVVTVLIRGPHEQCRDEEPTDVDGYVHALDTRGFRRRRYYPIPALHF